MSDASHRKFIHFEPTNTQRSKAKKKPNQFDHIKRQLHATYVIHSFRLSEWPEFVENEQFSTKNDKQQANEAVKYPIKMKYENNANGK